MASMAQITNSYEQRPIVLKHKTYAFYHPSAEAIASLIVDLPVKFITTVSLDLCLYFLANLNRTPGQFFYFLLFTSMVNLIMESFFQMISALTKSVSVANSCSWSRDFGAGYIYRICHS